MIIVLSRKIRQDQKDAITAYLLGKGFKVREIVGEEETVLGAVGSVAVDPREVELLPGVVRVIPISKAYKLVSRELKKANTIVSIGKIRIGGPRITVIGGPCAVESREQMLEAAAAVKDSGGVILRGGGYKPRTSPYSFQGLGEEGLKYLKEAGEKFGLPVVSEIVSTDTAELMLDYVDIFQIGARNMQNFELLKKVGRLGRPVLLKRGLAATIEEWLMAAEYLLAHGTEDVVLCERGIRTFETYTRNTLDLSAIPVVKKFSHLPIIVDPSHATGDRGKVIPMALAAVAAGADGLVVEMHPHPEKALSDGPQSLHPEEFEKLMRDVEALCPVVGKDLELLPAERLRSRPVVAPDNGSDSFAGVTVAFQGIRGAYSEQALQRYFHDHAPQLRECNRFLDVFREVTSGKADYGIIPIENSLAGSIHENYDLLIQHPDVEIVGEVIHRVKHCLIGKEGTVPGDLEKIFSHPQALAQCSDYLETLRHTELVPYYDTAGSVAYLAETKNLRWGAIANAAAARYYGLSVLKEGIESNPSNYTRFFIVTRWGRQTAQEPNKASLIFTLPDKAGALYNCIRSFGEGGLNMTKLESRPQRGQPWQYMFYVDVEVEKGNSRQLEEGIEIFSKEVEDFRNLGMYSQALLHLRLAP